MVASCISSGIDDAVGQWVFDPYDRDEFVVQQRLQSEFGPGGPQNPDFQIQPTVAQRFDILVRFRRETQAHTGRHFSHCVHETSGMEVEKAFARANHESALQLRKVQRFGGRTQDRLRGTRDLRGTWSRSARACGVSTIYRPARTSSGSSVASRNRASVRLIAEALRPSLRAAPATLHSARSTSSALSRLRSGVSMGKPTFEHPGETYIWRPMHL